VSASRPSNSRTSSISASLISTSTCPHGYFELLISRMEENPRLGTTSGKPYFVHSQTGALVPKCAGTRLSVGASKFYRRECFREIGGFVREVMWDGIDCHRCRLLGWMADSVDTEDLRFEHLRPMGSSHKGIWSGRVRTGYGQYFMRTSPLYLVASALFRLLKYPSCTVARPCSGAISRAPRGEWPGTTILHSAASWPLPVAVSLARQVRGHSKGRTSRRRTSGTRRTRASPSQKRLVDSRDRRELLDCPFDPVTMQSAVDQCLEWCPRPARSATP